jgi:hypothetical protein
MIGLPLFAFVPAHFVLMRVMPKASRIEVR